MHFFVFKAIQGKSADSAAGRAVKAEFRVRGMPLPYLEDRPPSIPEFSEGFTRFISNAMCGFYPRAGLETVSAFLTTVFRTLRPDAVILHINERNVFFRAEVCAGSAPHTETPLDHIIGMFYLPVRHCLFNNFNVIRREITGPEKRFFR
jgi:hypothetical protein